MVFQYEKRKTNKKLYFSSKLTSFKFFGEYNWFSMFLKISVANYQKKVFKTGNIRNRSILSKADDDDTFGLFLNATHITLFPDLKMSAVTFYIGKCNQLL